MEFLGLLISFVLGLLSSFVYKYIPNRVRVIRYIENVLIHVRVIIKSDVHSQEISHAHEVVKKCYDNVSKDIGTIAANNDVAKVRQALSAARIYYWIRFLTEKSDIDEIKQLMEDRQRRIQYGEVRSHSLEYVIQEIETCNSESMSSEYNITLWKANFQADIAELEHLYISTFISTRFKS